jgi:hypothetical protein
MVTMATERWYRLSEAAEKLGCSSSRLRQLVLSGECQATRVESPLVPTGYYWIVNEAEIARLRRRPNAFPQRGLQPGEKNRRHPT